MPAMKSLATFLLTLTLSAQDWNYQLLPATGDSPQPRSDGTIAYDAETASLYLFGGQGRGFLNDLWSYSLTNRSWRNINPSGTQPPARRGQTLVQDKQRRLILFGGQASGFFSDVWAFDLTTERWSQLGQDNAGPSRRYGHSAIYDPETNRMIVSHGFTNSGRFDDTWAFDLTANRWSNVTPSGTKPLPRCLHHAVFNPEVRQMYLYGGCASGFGPCPLGDLWSFDLRSNTWTELPSSSRTPGREYYGLTFDTRRNRLVLFGGSGGGLLGDTWLYDPTQRTWTQLELPGSPSPRSRHQGAYASDRGVNFFFGGSTRNGDSNEIWALSSSLPQQLRLSGNAVVNAFSGLAGPLAPGEYISIFGESLGPNPTLTLNSRPTPLLFANSTQMNLQLPFDLPVNRDITLRLTRNGESSNELSIPIVAAHPGLFPMGVNEDNSLNSATSPAASGAIIVFYATGQGTNPTQITLEIGGQRAELLFAATSPGAAGLMQINARIPAGLPTGAATVKLRIGDAESQPGVQLFIR